MRESLRHVLDRHVGPADGYPSGSIVLCASCGVPLFRLQHRIGVGLPASRSVDAYRPVTLEDLAELEHRPDVQAGIRAQISRWSRAERVAHVQRLPDRFRTGDPAQCPACDKSFVTVTVVSREETVDLAYVWELLTVPPRPAARCA